LLQTYYTTLILILTIFHLHCSKLGGEVSKIVAEHIVQPLVRKVHIQRHFLKKTHKRLFQCAVKGEWNEVLKICRENFVLNIPITESENTVLHLAAYNNAEDILEQLLLVREHHLTTISLDMKNAEGNTPLHIAASAGNVRMCRCIIEISKSTILLGVRNYEGETPLFKAVLHGHKDVFLDLHSMLSHKEEHKYNYCERNDGETILHCAITEEYYGEHFHT
jgi:hypothetical protein